MAVDWSLEHDLATCINVKVARHCRLIRLYLAAGDIERASYYADRVLVLVGKAITR